LVLSRCLIVYLGAPREALTKCGRKRRINEVFAKRFEQIEEVEEE
jgi:hypothetical protein